jgi:hypothetical protein
MQLDLRAGRPAGANQRFDREIVRPGQHRGHPRRLDDHPPRLMPSFPIHCNSSSTIINLRNSASESLDGGPENSPHMGPGRASVHADRPLRRPRVGPRLDRTERQHSNPPFRPLAFTGIEVLRERNGLAFVDLVRVLASAVSKA